MQVRDMRLRDVTLGMVFANDVSNHAGLLLIARGQEVTMPLLERVRTYWSGSTGTETVRMIVRSAPPSPVAGAATYNDEVQTADRGMPDALSVAAPVDSSRRPSRETAGSVPAIPSAASAGRFAWWR